MGSSSTPSSTPLFSTEQDNSNNPPTYGESSSSRTEVGPVPISQLPEGRDPLHRYQQQQLRDEYCRERPFYARNLGYGVYEEYYPEERHDFKGCCGMPLAFWVFLSGIFFV